MIRTIPPSLLLCLMLITTSNAQRSGDVYSGKVIKATMEKVCAWQLANPVPFNVKNENDWARAAFYTGVMATYGTTGNEKYLREAMKWSESFNYKLAQRLR